MLKFVIACLLSMSLPTWAAIININPGTDSIEGINVASGASVSLDGRSYQLSSIGAGLRRKKIAGPVALKVYVGQFILSQPGQFNKSVEGALASMDGQAQVVMHMTFLRDLTSEVMLESFEDSLAANGLSSADPDVARFLQMIRATGDVAKNTSIAIFITRNGNNTETLVYEVAGRRSFNDRHVATGGFIKKIASLWLGNPSDPGLADFQSDLLN